MGLVIWKMTQRPGQCKSADNQAHRPLALSVKSMTPHWRALQGLREAVGLIQSRQLGGRKGSSRTRQLRQLNRT